MLSGTFSLCLLVFELKSEAQEKQIKINRNLFSYLSKISATELHRWTQNSFHD